MAEQAIKELFGDSDDEDDLDDVNVLEQISDEEEEKYTRAAPLPSFKKREGAPSLPPIKRKKKEKDITSRRKPKRRRDEEIAADEEPRELSPEAALKQEVQRDFDGIMEKIKPKRVKKGDVGDDTGLDEMIETMVFQMKEAADKDQASNKSKQPAIAKLKMLSLVVENLNKSQLWDSFLDNNILEGIKAWLEPLLGDASLPSLDIQKAMFKALEDMPIRTQHLRESGLGRIVLFYTKCDRVEEGVQNQVSLLMDKWMRPIMKKSNNYRDRVVIQRDYDPRHMSYNKTVKEKKSSPSAEESTRTRFPQPASQAFEVVPRSNLSTGAQVNEGDNKKAVPDRFKKLNSKMMNLKRKGASNKAKFSVEGRGL